MLHIMSEKRSDKMSFELSNQSFKNEPFDKNIIPDESLKPFRVKNIANSLENSVIKKQNARKSDEDEEVLNVSQHLFNSYFNIDVEIEKDDRLLELQRLKDRANWRYVTHNQMRDYGHTNYKQIVHHVKVGGTVYNRNGYNSLSSNLSNSPNNRLPFNCNDRRKYLPPYCSFCKKRNEPYAVYTSHNLRNGSNMITCPMLSDYVCSCCGKRGHTLSHCHIYATRSKIFGYVNKKFL